MNKDDLYTLRWYINNGFVDNAAKVQMLKLIQRLLGEEQAKSVEKDERETPEPGEATMLKLAIVVGHEKKRPGATLYGGGSEYDYNSQLAELIKEFSPELGIETSIIYRDGIGIGGAYRKVAELNPDCAVELHFNAFNGIAHGTETLCSPAQHDKDLAFEVQSAMCLVFNRPGLSRGVKVLAKGDRGSQSVYALGATANCLVEPFFGDNPQEAEMARQRQGELAKSIVKGAREWAAKAGLLPKLP